MAGMPPELVLSGECLAAALRPAQYLFREASGREWCRVTQLSPMGLLGFTKFRMAAKLDLAVEVLSWGARYTLHRERGWLKSTYALLDERLNPVWSFVPTSFWRGDWTVTESRTGAVAVAKVANPLVIGPQQAKLELGVGDVLANLRWHGCKLLLGTFAKVQVEVFRRGWELPSVAFAVVRWLGLQNR